MKSREYRIGDKVIPKSKSVMGSLGNSIHWKLATGMGQSFLYIVRCNNEKSRYSLSHLKTDTGGDHFLGKDLEPYIEYEAFGHPEDSKVVVINPTKSSENKAMRFNESKPKVSLIHNESFIPMVKVLEFGSKKYEAHNWKKPMNKIEILESMKRHVDELIDKVVAGESELDSESNEHIIGHIMCNCMFYSYHNVIKK